MKFRTEPFSPRDDEGESKLFGCPVLPEAWIDSGIIGDSEIFLAQLRIDEKFPNEFNLNGYLYFFVEQLDNGGYKPIVRFCSDEPGLLVDDFNQSLKLSDDVCTPLKLVPDDNGCVEALCGCGDDVLLLEYNADKIGRSFMKDGARFMLSKAELAALEFGGCRIG